LYRHAGFFATDNYFYLSLYRYTAKKTGIQMEAPKGGLPDLYLAPFITFRGLMDLDSGLFRAYTVLPFKRVQAREKTGMT